MSSGRALTRRRASLLIVVGILSVAGAACGVIPFRERPAAGYVYGSGAALRVAIIDETAGTDWTPAIERAVAAYAGATPYLQFQGLPDGANIIVRVRRYADGAPPALAGYVFPAGIGGFAAVYDTEGKACNFPPSPLPLNCSGEIAAVNIYLNDLIPPGWDIDVRRTQLVLHELGHAMGLTRHSPDLDIAQLAQRYGWGASAGN